MEDDQPAVGERDADPLQPLKRVSDSANPHRVTSPPTTSYSSMSMSQPSLLPPLQQQHQHQHQQQQQQQHYDATAHVHMQPAHAQQPQYAAVAGGQPTNAPPMQQHHAHPPPYPHQQQHPFAYQNGASMRHPPPMPSNMVVNGNGTMRYAIPPQMAPGNMTRTSATAKQIKRRTKTGCLTCRKRRIKCDEAHPTCRNCQKSKRECLGYDPIFKQQPGPALIQPAPSGATGSTKSVSPSLPHYSPSQAYASAAGGYISSPQQGQSESAFGFAPHFDPALSPAQQAFAMQQSNGPPLHAARKASNVTMAQLFSLNNVKPQWQKRETLPPDFPLNEVEQFFRYHYAQGLDKLFETTWYTAHGWGHMQHDTELLDFVGQCNDRMKSSAEDVASVQAITSLEAQLVWQLSVMPRSALSANQAYGAISDPLLSDLLPRIDTVESILTGQFLPMVQLPSPPSVDLQNDPRKHNEVHFWHQLGRIASVHDDHPDPISTRDINDALAAMRGVLGLMENRDVLYSLAITRYIGGRLPDYDPQTPLTRTGNAENEVDKLETARQFVAMENEKGMTQVIQRVCGMAMRSSALQQKQ